MNTMTNPPPRPAACRLLAVITTPRLAERAGALLRRWETPLQYSFLAHGTASSEMLELLGLGSSDKSVLLAMLPRAVAEEILKKLHVELSLGAINSGIAFTLPISSGSNVLTRIMQGLAQPGLPEQEVPPMAEYSFSLVMAIVDQGYSEDVMNAARPAGARGGTVFHSRRVVNEETMRMWGISIQPEKEIVLIVVGNDYKKAIMQAISAACGVQSEAHGLVISMPVDEAIGLKLPTDD